MRKLRNSKKASTIFLPLVVLAALLTLSSAYYFLVNRTQGVEKTIGEEEYRLLGAYQYGESLLQYLEESGKYSAAYTINYLSGLGGYAAQPECGEIDGYTLWRSGGKDCLPTKDTISISYSVMFSNVLKEYTTPYLGDEILEYTLYFPEVYGKPIIAVPSTKLELVIGKNTNEEPLDPDILGIRKGDTLDKDALAQELGVGQVLFEITSQPAEQPILEPEELPVEIQLPEPEEALEVQP